MSLRIAHIDTEKTWRGGQQQVFSLIKGLNQQGHYNLSIVYKGSALSKQINKAQWPQLEVKPWGEWDLIAGRTIQKSLIKNKIDVVHAHAAHAMALAALATRNTDIPFVVTRRVDFHLANNPFSRWKYNQAAHIIAISQGVKDILLEDAIPNEKMTVVPSGIDFSRHENVKRKQKSEFGISANAYVVGQVAALAPHKDQKNFIKMISLLKNNFPEVVGVIVGEGNLRSSLERYARELGVHESIYFLGFQDNPLGCVQFFDVFCTSSKEEGLGTSIIDAMALNIPVVATRVGGIPELIEDEVTGRLVNPQSPESLADAILWMKNHPDQVNKMKENAVARAQQFDISRTIQGTEQVYKNILSTELSTGSTSR